MPGQAYVGEQYAIDLIQSEGDKDRAKYAAIGESDRFTLKFIKPSN
jgi:predicted methyltransferase